MSKVTMRTVSISLEKETHNKLRDVSKLKNCSISEIARKLINKHLDLVANDKDEVQIVLKIPCDIVKSEIYLKMWLDQKVAAITKVLTQKEQ